MKKRIIIHPLLFVLYPILALYVHNINELEPTVVFAPVLIALTITLFLWLIVSFIFRDSQKAGIFTSCFLLLLFSYGHVVKLLGEKATAFFTVGRGKYLFLSSGVVFLLLVYILLKKKIKRSTVYLLTNLFTIVAIFLFVISIWRIGSYYSTSPPSWQQTPPVKDKEEVKRKISRKEKVGPDIYYIIFDRYASAQTLKNYFNYDNSEFLNYLEEKGFYVVKDAFANYPITDLSLASSLNMEFLDELASSMGKDSSDFNPLYGKIINHRVWSYLEKRGYTYIHIGSTWEPSSKNWNADINYEFVHPFSLPSFSMKLFETTMFYPLLSKPIKLWGQELIKPLDYNAISREINLQQLSILTEIPKMGGTKFVFAHVLFPHEPYVFDRDGRIIPTEEAMTGDRKTYYLNQLIYANKLIKTMVEKLLKSTQGKSIIILQADEGPLTARYKQNHDLFQWQEATVDELRKKLGILNAYYLPGDGKSALYSSITPVNTFRLIFNLYFEDNLPMLPDEIYVMQDKKHPYKYIKVTEKLR